MEFFFTKPCCHPLQGEILERVVSNTVKTDPVLEAIAKKLFGIAGVPREEQSAMIKRAAKAGADALRKGDDMIKDETTLAAGSSEPACSVFEHNCGLCRYAYNDTDDVNTFCSFHHHKQINESDDPCMAFIEARNRTA